MSPSRPPTPRPAPARRPGQAGRSGAPAVPAKPAPEQPAADGAHRGRAAGRTERPSPRAERAAPARPAPERTPPRAAAERTPPAATHPERPKRPVRTGRPGRAERAAAKDPTPTTGAAPTAPATSRTTYQVRRFGGPVRPAVVSTRSQERFAERARAARNLARRQVALVVGGTVALLALAWLLLLSPVLALDPARVTVTGAGTVVAVDQVAAVVGRHTGMPLPRLDTAALRDEVLDVPGVRDATVTRDWPKGLTVALVSREPVAAVPEQQAPEGAAAPGFALLDEEGVQVGRVDAAPDGLPVVDVPVEQPRTLQAVLSVLRALPADLVPQIGGVSAHTQDTIAMTLRDGVTVEWGSSDETALKVAVLAALRASPAAAGATVIDVSAPRLPITR